MAVNGSAAAGDGLPERLLSDAEFAGVVARLLAGPQAVDRAVRVVVTSVERSAWIATYANGTIPFSEPSHARTFFEDGQLAVTCRCELWRTGPAASRSDADQLMSTLADLVRRHWGERDPATMLPYLKNAGVPGRFTAAARDAAAAGGSSAVLHTDLDHFKRVNDAVGEPGGNTVLREFADRLRQAFGELGVIVRTGGEEFSAFLDHGGLGRMILATAAFRRRMAVEPLAIIDRPNTCSVGLALFPDSERFADVRHPDDVLSEARDAEKRAKSDGRNRIALSGALPVAAAAQPISLSELRLAALSARRGGPAAEDPEAALCIAIREALLAAFARGSDAATAVAEVRAELSLQIGAFQVTGGGRPPQSLGLLDNLEWATAVAGALFASVRTERPMLKPVDALEIAVDDSGVLSIGFGEERIDLGSSFAGEGAIRASAGRPVYEAGHEPAAGIGRSRAAKAAPGCDPLSPVLLLPIGDAAKEIADRVRHLAAAVVDVDDRPTRGGGLPDFWQSNVSRVARACLANPNIGAIVAIGDVANAQLTLARLEQLARDEIVDLQRSLSMTPEDLSTLTSRGLALAKVAANADEVLGAVERAVVDLPAHDFGRRPVSDLLRRSRRRLPIGTPNRAFRLETTDGLRTRTFADVYPEALQLIRGADSSLDHLEPQRGTFREITGFKVVLTEPLQDRIADYWQPERELLDAYYARTFVNAEGLFGGRLQAPAAGSDRSMVDFAVDAVAEATARKTPTRRVNLPIIPDALDQPLGLSCIQLMPREREGVSVLDAIFVWRTVDALVGFPFSAYGSIRWMEDFLAQVNERLERLEGAHRVRSGTLTYIALSFHMYRHDGDVEIARTIVQDASL